LSCKSQNGFNKVSNTIYKNRLKNTKEYSKEEKISNSIRKEIFKNNLLSFYSESENLYLVEGYSIESGYSYIMIWNSKGVISYKIDNESYSILDEPLFNDDFKSIISKWDINNINNFKGKKLIGGLDMIANQVIFKPSGGFEIKQMSFEEFQID